MVSASVASLRPEQRQGQLSPSRGFVLPPLPSVAPVAFALPSHEDDEGNLLSTSSDSSSEDDGPTYSQRPDQALSQEGLINAGWSSEQTDDELELPFHSANPRTASAQSLSQSLTGRKLRQMPSNSGQLPTEAASSSACIPNNKPLLPSVWGRTGQDEPGCVRSYAGCAVAWCLVDGEGFLGVFPAALQVLWWHNVHRLVDLTVKHADLCSADGGQRGFCIVSGVHGGTPWENTQASVNCALQLMATLQQVQLPTGGRASVRIGIHFGPAADGLVGAGHTTHYQMVGPSVGTANQLALSAPPNSIVVSDVVLRHLSSGLGQPWTFARNIPVPLTMTREVQTHIYTGPLPEVLGDVQQVLDSWQRQAASSAEASGFPSPTEPPPLESIAGPSRSFRAGSSSPEIEPLSGGPEYNSSSALGKAWAGKERQQDGNPYGNAYNNVDMKCSDGLQWHEENFAELYKHHQYAVSATANGLMTVGMLIWLASTELPNGKTPINWMKQAPLLFITLLGAISCLPVIPYSWQSQAASFTRICRVAVLLYMNYKGLAGAPADAFAWQNHLGAFTVPLVSLGLIEGNLMHAHLMTDAVCLSMSLLFLPFIWSYCGFLMATFFMFEVLLGLVLPILLLSNLQQSALRDFAGAASRIFKARTSFGSSGPVLPQSDKKVL